LEEGKITGRVTLGIKSSVRQRPTMEFANKEEEEKHILFLNYKA